MIIQTKVTRSLPELKRLFREYYAHDEHRPVTIFEIEYWFAGIIKENIDQVAMCFPKKEELKP